MQEKKLQGMRVAILVTDDFEQAELAEPKKALVTVKSLSKRKRESELAPERSGCCKVCVSSCKLNIRLKPHNSSWYYLFCGMYVWKPKV